MKGFTLIEIVIVILIIASFTGLVGVNYVQYSEERKLEQSITQLKTVLAIARTRALSGDVGQYPCGNFKGLKIVSDPVQLNSYATTLCCAVNCGSPSYALTRYDLPTNNEFRNSFAVSFLPFAQGVDPNQETTIEIKNTFINKCNYVNVSRIGVIDTGKSYSC